MAQYFFDVTDLRKYLARHSQLSGIQRVSVMMIDRARKKIGANNIWFSYYDRKSNTYWACRCPVDPGVDLTQHSILSAVLNVRTSLRTLPGAAKYSSSLIKLLVYVSMRDLRARLGDTRSFKRCGISRHSWIEARAATKATRKMASQRIEFRKVSRSGDHLVLLDNAWRPKGLEQWLSYANHQVGVNVTVLLHDLIPLVTPQYTVADTCVRFREWLENSTSYVTHYLANSENTAADLRSFLSSANASQPVSIIPLAQDPLSGSDKRDAPLPSSYQDLAFDQHANMPDYIRAITKTPYVLVVGTLEVRKNLWQLATVWDRLRKQSGRALPKIVFAGRRGWLNEDFDTLIQATGQLGGWAEIVDTPSDDILDYLYRNCLFTVTVSFYEGWGLPIGESLGYGKTAVVSNTSSMPEVGSDMVEYCDPHSLDSIEAACLRLIDNPQHRAVLENRISQTKLRSWHEVTHDMLEAIRASS